MDRQQTGRRLNNPFPGESSSLGLVQGKLFCSTQLLGKHSWVVGEGFEVKWSSERGGCLSISHRDDPHPRRSVWSTLKGVGFVSAALGKAWVAESRGCFAFHEKAELLCSQQTVEEIFPVWPEYHKSIASFTHKRNANWMPILEDESAEEDDADGVKCVSRGSKLVITGCLYSHSRLALTQLEKFSSSKGDGEGPFYGVPDNQGCHCSLGSTDPFVGLRYWLIFSEKRDHHLSFILKLGQPVMPSEHSFDNDTNGGDSYGRRDGDEQENTDLRRLRRSKSHCDTLEEARDGEASCSNPSTLPLSGDQQLPQSNDMIQCFNMVQLTYHSEKSDRFYGFGEQFSFMDMKGRRVPILVQEQGIGRGDQPITAAANLVAPRAGGNWYTTYAPMPFCFTSSFRALFLENYEYSVFDLRSHDRVQVQVNAASMRGRILHGNTLPDLISHYTAAIGRMKALPDWILEGAIIGMQGGTESVKRIWKQLQQHEVPVAAFWLQDWVGKRKTIAGSQLWWNWELDTDHYPGWHELVKELQASNIRTMTYLNPFVTPTDEKESRRQNLFDEASNEGLLVKNQKGEPYMIPNTDFEAGLLDLTNPATCAWFKRIICRMVETGVRGWMADFGEALPFDSVLFSGKPEVIHNKYPELWAELNKDFIEEWEAEQRQSSAPNSDRHESFDAEIVFFMRAGYRASPRWCTLFWEGDQMVSWQRHDGLKSAVVGLLSSGLCGFCFNHSDIGGYTTVNLPFLKYKRSQELFSRWVEVNAFSTIFRTHEGNEPAANIQFYSNEQTFLHFARFAKIYKAWSFYRKQLVKEAAETGLPVVRHMILHYPEDRYVQKITYQQFLVGCEILVVPALDKGRKKVKAYFPPGDVWQHLWTSDLHGSPERGLHKGIKSWINAPLGYPAVFVKKHSSVGLQFIENLILDKIL